MALQEGLQLPYGIQPVVAELVDSWAGPYEGVDDATAIALANSSIPESNRRQTRFVNLIVNGEGKIYWYKDGTTDLDLVEFASGGGGGDVSSVNGETGDVVLDGTDIDLIEGGGISVTQAISDLATDLNTKVQSVSGDGVDNTDPNNPILSFPDTSEVTEAGDNLYVDSTEKSKIAVISTSGDVTKYLNENGAYSVPASGGSGLEEVVEFTNVSSVEVVHNWGVVPDVYMIDTNGERFTPVSVNYNLITNNSFEVTFGYDRSGTIITTYKGSTSLMTSFNGRSNAVLPEAGDYTVAQVTNAFNKTGDSMTGNIDMGGNNIVDGGSIAITGSYTGVDYNGVPLTSIGLGDQVLTDAGVYVPIVLPSILEGESAGISGSLNGNTSYTQTFTVLGAVVGDKVNCGFNDIFYDNLKSTGNDPHIIARVTAVDTVEVYFRIEAFMSSNPSRTVWAQIVK